MVRMFHVFVHKEFPDISRIYVYFCDYDPSEVGVHGYPLNRHSARRIETVLNSRRLVQHPKGLVSAHPVQSLHTASCMCLDLGSCSDHSI